MIYLIAVVLGMLRIMGEKAAWYQAVSHLFVGGLFGSWWQSGNKIPLIVAISLSILELVCFLVFKFVLIG